MFSKLSSHSISIFTGIVKKKVCKGTLNEYKLNILQDPAKVELNQPLVGIAFHIGYIK